MDEAAEVVHDEPTLSCGHPVSALAVGRDGRYCSACMEALQHPPAPAEDADMPLSSEGSPAETEPDETDDDSEEPDDDEDDDEDAEALDGGHYTEPGQPTTQPVYATLAAAPG